MADTWMALAAAFALGAAHALEVDHMVAVTAFIGSRPRIGPALSFGIRWGLGHAVVVLIVGGVLVLTGVSVPDRATGWAELGVGVMLIGVGVWAHHATRRLHVHTPHDHGGHGHLHAHPTRRHPHDHSHVDPIKHHRHLSTLVGAIHGLAGTAPVVALIPVTLMPNSWSAFGYLASFGIGTVVAMGFYSLLAAVAAAKAASSLKVARVVAGLTAGASIAVGMWWIARAVSDLAG
jgi:hypothetical protein